MIAFRRHLFFFLVVCTALAVGIALGGGPLQGRLAADEQTAGSHTPDLSSTVASLRRAQLFDDAMSAATSPQVVHDRLAGRAVALLVLPQVGESTVVAVTDAVLQAGGAITVVAHISPDLVNPAKKTYVDSLANSSLRGRDDVARAAGAGTYERISALVARAYVGHAGHTDFDAEAADIHAELEGARLVSTEEDPLQRGALVLVLAPAASARGELATASNLISTQLVSTLAAASDGVLVAGPPSSSSPGGLLSGQTLVKQVQDGSLSTLNVIDSPTGRVAAIYALGATADGQVGSYGTSASGPQLPPGLFPVTD